MSPDCTWQWYLKICRAMPVQALQLSTAESETAESAGSLPPRPPSFSEQVHQGLDLLQFKQQRSTYFHVF